jgi:hypothetical protein
LWSHSCLLLGRVNDYGSSHHGVYPVLHLWTEVSVSSWRWLSRSKRLCGPSLLPYPVLSEGIFHQLELQYCIIKAFIESS